MCALLCSGQSTQRLMYTVGVVRIFIYHRKTETCLVEVRSCLVFIALITGVTKMSHSCTHGSTTRNLVHISVAFT